MAANWRGCDVACGGVPAIGRQLDDAERSDAVGADAAKLAVEIGLLRADRCHGLGDRGIFVRSVEPCAREYFATLKTFNSVS